MSNQQGDKPPSAAPAGAYGPGHTILGEPAFVEENAPAAFPPQATPAAPYAGAVVPPTVFDAAAFVPPPQYPVSPYAGGTAPAAGFGPPGYGMPGGPPPPTAGYTAPAQNPYGGPPPAYPAPSPQRSAPRAAAGPPMLVIGLAAFAVIGGLTTFLALRSRGSSEDSDKPVPTIDVPPMATVPSDPGPGAAGADPTEPPPAAPVPVAPPAPVPTQAAPKPASAPPKPVVTSTTPTPTVTTRPTSTAVPAPTTTTRPPKGPVIVPRHPIPKR